MNDNGVTLCYAFHQSYMHAYARTSGGIVVVTFATRCLNCHQCVDLPVWMVTVRIRDGVTRWAYECPLCTGWCNRQATPAQLAAFTLAGIMPRPEMAAISEADCEKFAEELAAMP